MGFLQGLAMENPKYSHLSNLRNSENTFVENKYTLFNEMDIENAFLLSNYIVIKLFMLTVHTFQNSLVILERSSWQRRGLNFTYFGKDFSKNYNMSTL